MLATLVCVAVQKSVLTRAHSHNDYAQKRPLALAMENQFGSIEADVFLVDGKLLVAHDTKDLKPERNLVDMYLKPMAEAVKKNNGHLYEQPGEVILLVDIKRDGTAVYEELKKELEPFRSMLATCVDGQTARGAIMVVLSGDRPVEAVKAESNRMVFIDGRLDDTNRNPNLAPIVSADWGEISKWRGAGPFPAEDRAKLDAAIAQAHANNQRIRFWATPETDATWNLLFYTGVDLIGTDLIPSLAKFLRGQPRQ
jgi:hypothetical protein